MCVCRSEPHAYVDDCVSWPCFVHLAELGLLCIPCSRKEGSTLLFPYPTSFLNTGYLLAQYSLHYTLRISFLKQTFKCWQSTPNSLSLSLAPLPTLPGIFVSASAPGRLPLWVLSFGCCLLYVSLVRAHCFYFISQLIKFGSISLSRFEFRLTINY